MKPYRGSRGIAPLILNHGILGRWVVNFTARPLYPLGKGGWAKKHCTHWIWGKVGPSAGLMFLGRVKPCVFTRIWTKDHPVQAVSRFLPLLDMQYGREWRHAATIFNSKCEITCSCYLLQQRSIKREEWSVTEESPVTGGGLRENSAGGYISILHCLRHVTWRHSCVKKCGLWCTVFDVVHAEDQGTYILVQ